MSGLYSLDFRLESPRPNFPLFTYRRVSSYGSEGDSGQYYKRQRHRFVIETEKKKKKSEYLIEGLSGVMTFTANG